jgi:predicted enzyme related to lactoylglutathione lyase
MGSPVMHWQMVSTDPERTAKFYGKLFNWKITAGNALGYRVVETLNAKGIAGGIWPAPQGATSLVQLFIEVDNVETYVQQAVALGATVIVPTATLPDGDVMAVVLDPVGLPFGIVQRKSTNC